MKKLYFSTFVPGLERPVEAMLRKEGGVAVERVLPGAALYRSVRTPAFSFVHQSFQVLFQMKPVAGADDAVKRLLATGGWLDRFPYEETEGKKFRYGGLGAPLDKWGPWFADCARREGTLDDVKHSFLSMVTPEIILDIFRNFTLYRPNKRNTGLIKIVCRYQQYEGANAIVKRCVEGKVKKGLIWHFQGSGKSYLILFAAQKLRMKLLLRRRRLSLSMTASILKSRLRRTSSGPRLRM